MRAKKTAMKTTVQGTLKEMIRSVNHLVEAHKEIVLRERHNSVLSDKEVSNFCQTLEGIKAAAQECRQ